MKVLRSLDRVCQDVFEWNLGGGGFFSFKTKIGLEDLGQ